MTSAGRARGTYTAKAWGGPKRLRAIVFALYGDRCWLCGKPGARTVDHVVPISKGGAMFDVANMRPAHMSCNQSRGNRVRHYAERAHAAVVPDRTSRRW
jgi:5-methylcytosine-specific restriction endonuclease McrA